MSIRVPRLSNEASLSFRRNVAVQLRRGTVAGGVRTSRVAGTPYKAAGPYPIYNGTIDGLMGNTLLKSTELTAWAYLVIDGTSARIAEAAWRNDEMMVVAFYPPSYARVFVNALWRAERYDLQNPNEDSEMRVLRVPSLSLSAIWLHGNVSRLAPIYPYPSSLQNKKIYSETALTDLLRPMALRRRDSDDREM